MVEPVIAQEVAVGVGSIWRRTYDSPIEVRVLEVFGGTVTPKTCKARSARIRISWNDRRFVLPLASFLDQYERIS